MAERKTKIRFFTIADYENEENWLRSQHRAGWKLVKMVPPCFFTFEACEPEDVVYRLDYKNGQESGDYLRLFQDYGWEHCGTCLGWLYFRKPAGENPEDGEIFSDDASRLEMIDHILKTRLLPLAVIFLCCVVPNFTRAVSTSDPAAWVLTLVFSALMGLYVFLLLYCGIKLRKLREKYKKG